MPIEIEMPRLSDTMEEGTVVAWNVKVGDKVSAGDHLADIETDKATMQLESFDDGIVAKLNAGEGDTVAVGGIIMVLAAEGESVEDAAKAAGGGNGGAKSKPKAAEKPKVEGKDGAEAQEDTSQAETVDDEEGEAEEESEAPSTGSGRVKVSPLARRIAEDKGLDLAKIKGTGPDGRVIKRDVLAAAEGKSAKADAKPAAPAKKAASSEPVMMPSGNLEAKKVPVSNMRKTIAKRLVESKTTIPHFQVTMAINMDPLMGLRTTLNGQLEAQGVKLSVNDFIVRACALALLQHPMANASWTGDGIQQHGSVNIGIAVALPEERGGGLVVPTIRETHRKGLRAISQETRTLAKKAREIGLTMEEMSEGTFTISNLGMYGVEHFTAIINPPQVAILAVGAAVQKPVVRDGQIVVGHEMQATLSADHRVLDGASAAEFMQTVKQLLENPATLLV
jgi:pyruvate dehydrogenase E2 component (dihydrolipoamide acetyltransferase)